MSQYLQGVTGDTPLQAGLACLPATVAAFAAATATSRLIRRTSNAQMSIAGCAGMLIGTAWISRVSADTSYLTGIALPKAAYHPTRLQFRARARLPRGLAASRAQPNRRR